MRGRRPTTSPSRAASSSPSADPSGRPRRLTPAADPQGSGDRRAEAPRPVSHIPRLVSVHRPMPIAGPSFDWHRAAQGCSTTTPRIAAPSTTLTESLRSGDRRLRCRRTGRLCRGERRGRSHQRVPDEVAPLTARVFSRPGRSVARQLARHRHRKPPGHCRPPPRTPVRSLGGTAAAPGPVPRLDEERIVDSSQDRHIEGKRGASEG